MDMNQYLDMYLEEAREHLQTLNEDLLKLEGAPDNRAILDEIFRSAHTLKGMSAAMGFNQVAELTHGMENVLHKLRNREINVSSEIVDLLFKCMDSVESMVNDISNGGNANLVIGDLLAELRIISGFDSSGKSQKTAETPSIITSIEVDEYEKNLLMQAINQGYQCYHLVVKIDPRSVMKSARAFMVFKNMEQIGEIIKSIPPVQDIEAEKFTNSFDLIIISKEPPEIVRKGLVSISEVAEPEINLVTELFSRETATPVPAAKNSGNQKENKPISLAKPKISQTLRVDTTRLDNLMNLVGELVINKGRLEQISRAAQIPELSETLEQMDRICIDLQDVVMKVRMVPIDNVFSRFPRMVRDLAKELGKEVELIIQGEDTELDRTVINEIGDPLVHLLRNAVDHGIEEPAARVIAGKKKNARIMISAYYEGNNVVIEVADDGKGLDPKVIKERAVTNGLLLPEEAEKLDESSILRLIFQPGFSTAEKVTDVSGRGVGLDAVKNKIEALSGSIFIKNNPGLGAQFKIQLPLTLAIIQALLVLLEREIYAIPLNFIAETTSVFAFQIKKIQDQEVIQLRGEVLPLIRLHEILQVPSANIPKNENEIDIVVVKKGDKMVGLIVDTLIGQQEIVIKPLGKLVGNTPLIAGATILGNGQVSLIIDVAGLC